MWVLASTSLQRVLPGWRKRLEYGPALEARKPIRRFAATIARLVDAHAGASLPAGVAEALREPLHCTDLLARCHLEGDEHSYRRHLLYADPLGRFSILALVWRPGQGTPVHGHTAWGCVGVYQGALTVSTFALTPQSGDTLACRETATVVARPGDTGYVRAGILDIHQISNRTETSAVSIHVYGKDLLRDPASLNIDLPH
jgi:predicted metal-dependent enzyme (double-stranded beta helix superfamily)